MLSRADLHPYQRRAVEYILERPACALWLDLGLGKTISTLTAISDMIASCTVERVLVIAPLRVARSVWHNEAAQWEHTQGLRFSLILGTQKERTAALSDDADVWVINRENVPWLVAQLGDRWPFDCVVIDEASSFKSSKARRWRALRKVRKHIDRIVELTATPSSNGLIDLWAQTYLLDVGARLGKTKTGYLQRYFESDYWGRKWTPRPGTEQLIHERLSDIVLSMQASDYLSMPERIDIKVGVDLPAESQRVYKALERDLIVELGADTVDATNAATLATKLLQVCNGAIYTETSTEHLHDAKLDALADLREQNPDDNMLVAYGFRSDEERLCSRFLDAVSITEPDAIERWNAGEIPMLLAHPASAGHGLNLQHGGSLIVWFGLNWSLELYEQFNGRLHRQGQTKPVRVVHLVANDCIDERVLATLKNKTDVQRNLLSALKDLLIDGGKE